MSRVALLAVTAAGMLVVPTAMVALWTATVPVVGCVLSWLLLTFVLLIGSSERARRPLDERAGRARR